MLALPETHGKDSRGNPIRAGFYSIKRIENMGFDWRTLVVSVDPRIRTDERFFYKIDREYIEVTKDDGKKEHFFIYETDQLTPITLEEAEVIRGKLAGK